MFFKVGANQPIFKINLSKVEYIKSFYIKVDRLAPTTKNTNKFKP